MVCDRLLIGLNFCLLYVSNGTLNIRLCFYSEKTSFKSLEAKITLQIVPVCSGKCD